MYNRSGWIIISNLNKRNKMKVNELLKEIVAINEAISYDNDTKKLSGTTKEWLHAIGGA